MVGDCGYLWVLLEVPFTMDGAWKKKRNREIRNVWVKKKLMTALLTKILNLRRTLYTYRVE